MSYKDEYEKLVKIIIEERNKCLKEIREFNKISIPDEQELTGYVKNIAIRNRLNAIIKMAHLEDYYGRRGKDNKDIH